MLPLRNFYSDLVSAVGRQDVTTIRTLIHPDFEMHYDSTLPFGGTYRGVDGFLAVLGELGARLTDATTEQVSYMEDADGGQYGVVIQLRATTAGSGRRVDTIVSEVWTVRAGKAVEARIWYWGAAGLLDE